MPYYLTPDGRNGDTDDQPPAVSHVPTRLVGYFHLEPDRFGRTGFVPLDDQAHAAEVERDTAPDAS